MRNFCEFLREHAMKITNFRKKKIKLLTKEQQEPNENRKIYNLCTKKKKKKKIQKNENIYEKDKKL